MFLVMLSDIKRSIMMRFYQKLFQNISKRRENTLKPKWKPSNTVGYIKSLFLKCGCVRERTPRHKPRERILCWRENTTRYIFSRSESHQRSVKSVSIFSFPSVLNNFEELQNWNCELINFAIICLRISFR